MKKKGSICEFHAQRDSELVKCFRICLGAAKVIDLDKIFRKVASMPASRFYVSEFRATRVIRTHQLTGEWPVKGKRLAMFKEIERRLVRLMNDDRSISFDDAMTEVINSPAPEFYLTPRSCRTYIYKSLKK